MAVEYPIDMDIAEGDPAHVEHHEALAESANDHEERLVVLENTPDINTGVFGTWNTTELVGGEFPEGSGDVILYQSGMMVILAIRGIDAQGSNFNGLLHVLPAGSRVQIVSASVPHTTKAMFKLDTDTVFNQVGDGTMWSGVGTLVEGSVSDFPSGGAVTLIFEMMPSSSVVSDTPTLDEVLTQGASSDESFELRDEWSNTQFAPGAVNIFTTDETSRAGLDAFGVYIADAPLVWNADGVTGRVTMAKDSITRRQDVRTGGVLETTTTKLLFEPPTVNREIIIPDASGTLALVEGLPGPANLDSVLESGNVSNVPIVIDDGFAEFIVVGSTGVTVRNLDGREASLSPASWSVGYTGAPTGENETFRRLESLPGELIFTEVTRNVGLHFSSLTLRTEPLPQDTTGLTLYLPPRGGVVALIDDIPEAPEVPAAGLNQVGFMQAVFIENGGTVPGGLDPFTVVIELGP